jgi:hypothetical protein
LSIPVPISFYPTALIAMMFYSTWREIWKVIDTPRKTINRHLCRCCNRFSPSQERPIGLFGRKAKKERTVELIFEFGHVRTVENDGCGQLICKQCFAKVTKIQKLIRDFREACISTEEKQKEARDRSKRCRREERDNRDENINQPLTKHRYLPILPHPSQQSNNSTTTIDTSTATRARRTLPFSTFGRDSSSPPITSYAEEILKSSGLNNPDVCTVCTTTMQRRLLNIYIKIYRFYIDILHTNNVALRSV